MMQFERQPIPDLVVIIPKRFGDGRGYFMETFVAKLFESEVGQFHFVQDNRSLSAEVGTVRGLHYQLDPKAQGKLVSCSAGAMLDVAVDIRAGSPTYGRHVAVELTAENARQLWIPSGFAHGFCTLEPNTVVSYKVTEYYSPEHDRGMLWSDPALGIAWPVAADKAVLSDKDRKQPFLADAQANFTYTA
jgi:dTDP-4-dehydrorhamnose 3,5-epimerase